MSFFIDVVTEDAFYENLTLGVVKILENSPCVKNVQVERRNGCERGAITSWEQRHCCKLSEDVRDFYASIDGFLLTWDLEISGEEFSVGRMEIGSLSSVKRYVTITKERPSVSSTMMDPMEPTTTTTTTVETAEPNSATESNNEIDLVPIANSRGSKLFEIGECYPRNGRGKIYMSYRTKPDHEMCGIWLHRAENNQWYRLADNFTKYFRMMLVHLGLPLWQYCIADLPLPTWIEQVYFLVGPHLLPNVIEPTETISTSIWNNGPTNVLDSVIFKGKDNKQTRNTRKK